jgi:hypothetical protein
VTIGFFNQNTNVSLIRGRVLRLYVSSSSFIYHPQVNIEMMQKSTASAEPHQAGTSSSHHHHHQYLINNNINNNNSTTNKKTTAATAATAAEGGLRDRIRGLNRELSLSFIKKKPGMQNLLRMQISFILCCWQGIVFHNSTHA